MIVAGLTRDKLTTIAGRFGFELENLRPQGKRQAFQIKVRGDRYRRLRTRPRQDGVRTRTAFPCYHGYRDFVAAVFIEGATLLISSLPGGGMTGDGANGRWESWEEFEKSLYGFEWANVGTAHMPVYMIELCECDDDA